MTTTVGNWVEMFTDALDRLNVAAICSQCPVVTRESIEQYRSRLGLGDEPTIATDPDSGLVVYTWWQQPDHHRKAPFEIDYHAAETPDGLISYQTGHYDDGEAGYVHICVHMM